MKQFWVYFCLLSVWYSLIQGFQGPWRGVKQYSTRRFASVETVVDVTTTTTMTPSPSTTTSSSTRKYFFYNQKYNKDPLKNKLKNMQRKIRRNLYSSTTPEKFTQLIYHNADYDEFLKSRASATVYSSLMKKIQKRARQLGVTIQPEFGKRRQEQRSDILSTAIAAGSFTKLVAAVQAAGLIESLQSKGDDSPGTLLTVFAPSDEAFAQLPEGTLEALLADIPKLQQLLKHHVLEGSNSAKKLLAQNGQSLKTLASSDLPIKAGRGENSLVIGDAEVTQSNIKCRNGYIHVINKVLLPNE